MRQGDLHWHHGAVTRERREAQNGHRAGVLWFTGLSGAGKSTLAHAVEEALHASGHRTIVLDGDNVRHGLCGDLGFSAEDRAENLRRIAETCRLMVDAGLIVLAAFISPLRSNRAAVRQLVGAADFFEIHVDCPLVVCEGRDVKGSYARARRGEIAGFTGVSAPYEAPESPDLVVTTDGNSIQACVAAILDAATPRIAPRP